MIQLHEEELTDVSDVIETSSYLIQSDRTARTNDKTDKTCHDNSCSFLLGNQQMIAIVMHKPLVHTPSLYLLMCCDLMSQPKHRLHMEQIITSCLVADTTELHGLIFHRLYIKVQYSHKLLQIQISEILLGFHKEFIDFI